jgi:hypothetical protein
MAVRILLVSIRQLILEIGSSYSRWVGHCMPLRAIKAVAVQLTLLVSTLAMMDIALYIFLPDEIARNLPGYRKERSSQNRDRPLLGQGYYISHLTRGFDIGPGRSGMHEVEDIRYPVWSNSMGCFDREWSIVPAQYYYFAGDSFTWGHNRYENKFATIFEHLSGVPSLKCGVGHTGQLHQFSKFKEVVSSIGHYPQRVIVTYFDNDVANDYAHPHTTVIDGWRVDTKYTDLDDKLYTPQEQWLHDAVAGFAAQATAPRAGSATIKDRLRQYSASAQIINFGIQQISDRMFRAKSSQLGFDYEFDGKAHQNFLWIWNRQTAGGLYRYRDYPIAERNKEAITQWARDAEAHGYRLTFLLVPQRQHFGNQNYYHELRLFLSALGIDHIDMSHEFRQRGLRRDHLYRSEDIHFSPEGERLVAQLLIDKFAIDKLGRRQRLEKP